MDSGFERLALRIALETESVPSDRLGDFLGERCEGEEGLECRVRELLVENSSAQLGAAGGTFLGANKVPVLMPKTRLGDFVLGEMIGRGGMGRVYEATQDSPRRKVAVKVLSASPIEVEAFEREVQIVSSLQHPCIAQVYQTGVSRDPLVAFIAMECVAGSTDVASYVADKGLGVAEIVELFLQVCSAVEHGHQSAVVHRDIKPSNVLVGESGVVKVIDFGLARYLGRDWSPAEPSRHHGGSGTLDYMSPEQLDCAGSRVDTRSDIYSLGVLLWELLTGRRFRNCEEVSSLLQAVELCQTPPVAPNRINRKIPVDLGWIVLRMLEDSPEQRYQSVSALKEELDRFLNGRPVLAGRPTGAYIFLKQVKRSPVASGLWLALAVAILGALLMRERAERRHTEAMEDEMGASDLVVEKLVGTLLEMTAFLPWGFADDVSERLITEVQSIPSPRKTSRVLEASALLQLALGNHAEAESDARTLVQLTDEHWGGMHRRSLRAQHILAKAKMGARRYGAAEEILATVIERLRDGVGFVNHEVLEAMSNHGVALHHLGRWAECKKLQREVISGFADLYGPNHRDTIAAENNYASTLIMTKEVDEADRILEANYPRMLGLGLGGGRDALIILNSRAGVSYQRGDYYAAQAMFEEAAQGLGRLLGKEHPSVLSMRLNRVGCLRLVPELVEEGKRVAWELFGLCQDPDLEAIREKALSLLGAMYKSSGDVDSRNWQP